MYLQITSYPPKYVFNVVLRSGSLKHTCVSCIKNPLSKYNLFLTIFLPLSLSKHFSFKVDSPRQAVGILLWSRKPRLPVRPSGGGGVQAEAGAEVRLQPRPGPAAGRRGVDQGPPADLLRPGARLAGQLVRQLYLQT